MPSRLTNEVVDLRLRSERRTFIRKGNYINMTSKILWECLTCGYKWKALPGHIIHTKTGCPSCMGNAPLNNEIIDNRVIENNRNIRRIGDYVNTHTVIDWECLECGYRWSASPSNVLNKNHPTGCSRCVDQVPLTNQSVDIKLKERKIRRIGDIVNAKIKIDWECLECSHIWYAKPNNILSGKGCPKCAASRYSNMAISWLEKIEEEEGIYIQHARNNGEYVIPGTKMRTDGYCENTNTIYEFYGDCFHGNPYKFKSNDKCNPYDKTSTAESLYIRTIEREKKIKELGYKLVTIWESEWLTQL